MTITPDFVAHVVKILGHFTGVSEAASEYFAVALGGVAKTLLEAANSHLLTDVKRLADARLAKKEADADLAAAEAKLKAAEATEAVNRATLPKRKDRIAQAEKRKAEAEADLVEAKVKQLETETKTDKLKAQADALAALVSSVERLRTYGGDLVIDSNNLRIIESVAITLQTQAQDDLANED